MQKLLLLLDEKQNIYSRELDNEKMPRIPVQTGAWDRKLNKSYRLSQKIALLVTDFQKRFLQINMWSNNKLRPTL